MMLKRIFLVAFLLTLVSSVGLYYYLKQTYPTTPPAQSCIYFLEHLLKPHAAFDKHVMGFLPYWQIDNLTYVRPESLSEINYFSLTVGDDGKLITVTNGETDPGWRVWQTAEVKDFITKAHIMGSEVTFTAAALTNDSIETILSDPAAQQNLINDVIAQIKERHLDGVNIDFEYLGDADPVYREAFTTFSKDLKQTMQKEVPNAELSISLMPLAARQEDIFDFPKLAPLYDRFIGMSYEYYGKNSDIAAPTAPMKGFKENQYFFDVTTTYEDYIKVLPKEKIVMGIPYYGWERAVEDGKTKNSLTFPQDDPNNYAVVISYARARESKELKKSQCTWDTTAQETWCWYKDKTSGIDRQVWIADDRSIKARFDYANKQQFAGIGIWTLGYDKDYPDLWNLLKTSFSN